MKPAGPDRYVRFACWPPHDTIAIPMLQPLGQHIWRIVSRRAARAQDLPCTNSDRLRKARARSRIQRMSGPASERHQRLWLQLPHREVHERPIVHLLLAIGTFAVRAVEKQFDNRTVLREQFRELRGVVLVVLRAVAVRFLVAIPRRQIPARPQSFPRPASRSRIPSERASPSFPPRHGLLFTGMIGVLAS